MSKVVDRHEHLWGYNNETRTIVQVVTYVHVNSRRSTVQSDNITRKTFRIQRACRKHAGFSISLMYYTIIMYYAGIRCPGWTTLFAEPLLTFRLKTGGSQID